MVDVLRRWWLVGFVLLAALWLRTHDLDKRPMHADEANQAVKAGELLEAGRYAFDPRDHHGPTLYFAALPIAWLRGERSLAELSETTVRWVPAIFGTISVFLAAVLAGGASQRALVRGASPTNSNSTASWRPLPWFAFTVAAFVAVSPPSVYYSRYFVQETLLVTFTLATFVCAQRWWRAGTAGWAIGVGAGVGLMQATKASAPLFLVAAAIAAAVAVRARRSATAGEAPLRRPWLRHAAFAAGAAVLVAALFYSSFGRNPAGLADAVRTYTQAFERFGTTAPPTGHEKPWWYYLQLFAWKRTGGLLWHQVAFSTLAVAGFVIAVVRMFGRRAVDRPETTPTANGPRVADRVDAVAIWAGVYSVVVVGALSAFAYKTPWHAVHFVPGLALLAAYALASLCQLNTGTFVAVAATLVTIGSLYQQTARTAFLRPADARNPYAYVHSSADVLKFRALAQTATAQFPGQPIRVISEEYWPLPWYFRGLSNVGYWSEVPADCDGALVITSQATAEAVAARLREHYQQRFLGLRPGFVCILFVREP